MKSAVNHSIFPVALSFISEKTLKEGTQNTEFFFHLNKHIDSYGNTYYVILINDRKYTSSNLLQGLSNALQDSLHEEFEYSKKAYVKYMLSIISPSIFRKIVNKVKAIISFFK
jgi:hypothetical protein